MVLFLFIYIENENFAKFTNHLLTVWVKGMKKKQGLIYFINDQFVAPNKSHSSIEMPRAVLIYKPRKFLVFLFNRVYMEVDFISVS